MAKIYPDIEVLVRRSMKGGGNRGAKRPIFLQITARTKTVCDKPFEVSERNIHESRQVEKTEKIKNELKDKVKSHINKCNKCNK